MYQVSKRGEPVVAWPVLVGRSGKPEPAGLVRVDVPGRPALAEPLAALRGYVPVARRAEPARDDRAHGVPIVLGHVRDRDSGQPARGQLGADAVRAHRVGQAFKRAEVRVTPALPLALSQFVDLGQRVGYGSSARLGAHR